MLIRQHYEYSIFYYKALNASIFCSGKEQPIVDLKPTLINRYLCDKLFHTICIYSNFTTNITKIQ